MSLLELYCAVDDFYQAMEKEQVGRLIGDGKPTTTASRAVE